MKRTSALSPYDLFRLDLACKPIRLAFGNPPYLVGSANTRPDPRDIDVRLILDDADYDRIIATPAILTMLNMAITAYLRESTRLPIDFGIQRRTEANTAHDGFRNPLGMRSLEEWTGDAPVTRHGGDT